MNDYRSRAMEEFRELDDKIDKLKTFILAPRFEELPDVDRRDLKEQLGHMQAYHDVLMRRVSRMCNNA